MSNSGSANAQDVASSTSNVNAFDFQLQILKQEISQIHSTIQNIGQTMQKTKNWAITVWAGSIALCLGSTFSSSDQYVFLTSLIPIPFWLLETQWRRIQHKFIFRLTKISEFLNSDEFFCSFREKKFKNFLILDEIGMQYEAKDDQSYIKVVSFWRSFAVASVIIAYVGMIAISIILGIALTFF